LRIKVGVKAPKSALENQTFLPHRPHGLTAARNPQPARQEKGGNKDKENKGGSGSRAGSKATSALAEALKSTNLPTLFWHLAQLFVE
jgi:hypothetical protein